MPSQNRRRIPAIVLAVITACVSWFFARGTQPQRALPMVTAWLTAQPASVFAAVISDTNSGPTPAESPVSLPQTLYTGQLAIYGPKPGHLDVWSVTLDWQNAKSALIVDGHRYPLIDPVHQNNEIHFAVQGLIGRKGRWDIRMRVGVASIAGPVIAPNDPLLGGYLLVSQQATRHMIPPPPVPPRRS